MPLSLFIDALPYSEISSKYKDWIPGMQYAVLKPNVGYSSSLHWQLYCNKYPDERGSFVDWVRCDEQSKAVRFVSTMLSPLDQFPKVAYVIRKGLDRVVFKRNAFANIPFKYRRLFREEGKYLFWDEKTYHNEPIFDGYTVVSQDEGHLSFEETFEKMMAAIESGQVNIQGVFGFADSEGHKCRRGELYSERLKPYMDKMQWGIMRYLEIHPNEDVLVVSDHGMSTVKENIDLGLETKFGKQSLKSYIAYSDSAIMCVWADNTSLRKAIAGYLANDSRGHLLTNEERKYYGIADLRYGDLIYNLREGYCFAANWFGRSLRKPSEDGVGMHGFWPELAAKDQMASIILVSHDLILEDKPYSYREAHALIERVMVRAI